MAIPDVTEAQLRIEIKAYTQADSVPVLTDSEIDILVRQSFLKDSSNNAPDLAFERVSSKQYSLGTKMVPMNRNGHVYICVKSGVTSTEEPEFPGDTEEVVEDGTVEWEENGSISWEPTYNCFPVIAFGWEMKAGKCVGDYGFSSDGQTFNRQQVYEHCMNMVKQWKAKQTGSVNIVSHIKKTSRVPDAFSHQLPEEQLEELGWI